MLLQPETRAGPWYLKAGLTTPQINTLKQVLILEMESGRNLALAWSAPIARLSVFSDLSCLHLWCKIYIPANTLRWNIWPCHSLDTKILTLEMVSKIFLDIRAARNSKKYIYIFRIFCLDQINEQYLLDQTLFTSSFRKKEHRCSLNLSDTYEKMSD